MKATIEIEFTIDGKTPDHDTLTEAIWKIVSEAGYIGSEEVDGTDEWGLEISETRVTVSDAHGQAHPTAADKAGGASGERNQAKGKSNEQRT